ncbi:MAG: aminotransferase class III-fold pyridoxal phosphate-dependent enzyme, partial [Chitinophagaceae bacterium]|nr:aminotransferase class III-fold pyridoxal phosphate-dependent enzyme [Chitinophagaceae bacterium]
PNAATMGKYLSDRAEEMKQRHPSIGDFRTRGLLGCFELVKNRKTKEPMAPYNASAGEMMIMNKVAARLKELGMYTFVRWSFVFVAPPLCITKDQIDEGLSMLGDAFTIADEYAQ